ncbi:sugar phosphate isomerase/epimerase family protein [Gracilibacillus kekensis]|uniref:Sugar phosphate isomerase/epimerase n=1 Tax=Gracilibacillus kekensis TaxID=1027249 RepID=A0A1M7QSV5_9BACI|nr:sugar phosphate isomerase/epimerase [Gracilibacillus kekensis]SHN34625.1 Sugar phosphate isomerase/epimerase [Gracilibacillus kekensis]
MHNPIGVITDGFQQGLWNGLNLAGELKVENVQIYAVSGEMDPDIITTDTKKRLKESLDKNNLTISALCGDLEGHGFQDRTVNREKIDKSKRILELAVELGTPIVTTHIGIVPQQDNDVYQAMLEACDELGKFATSLDAHFAVETGPEPAAHLKTFLDQLSTNGVSVNFDPGNMVMVTGDYPVQGVYTLKDYIVHTHVKDGKKLGDVDPRDVYGALGYKPMCHDFIAEMVESGTGFRETALGKGSVPFDQYFQSLMDIGYNGALIVEREAGTNAYENIKQAVQYLQNRRSK